MATVRAFCDHLDATSTEWTTSGCNIYRVGNLLDATSTEWTTFWMQHLQSGRPSGCNIYRVDDLLAGCNIYRVDDLLDATSTEWTTHHSPLRTITPHATRFPPLIESNIFVANPTTSGLDMSMTHTHTIDLLATSTLTSTTEFITVFHQVTSGLN